MSLDLRRFSFCRERWPTAARSYECHHCGMLIRPGQRHWLLIVKTRVRFRQYRACLCCEKALRPKHVQPFLTF